MTNKYGSTENKKLVASLLLFAACILGFAFILLPNLYEALCEFMGPGCRPNQAAGVVVKMDQPDRSVKVEFVTTVNEYASWEFTAAVDDMTVHAGKLHEALFFAANLTDQHRVAQVVPIVTPPQAARYFRKLDCFCFSSQEFAPGEVKVMPVRFMVASELPESIGTITLSYAFFDTARAKKATDYSPSHEQSSH